MIDSQDRMEKIGKIATRIHKKRLKDTITSYAALLDKLVGVEGGKMSKKGTWFTKLKAWSKARWEQTAERPGYNDPALAHPCHRPSVVPSPGARTSTAAFDICKMAADLSAVTGVSPGEALEMIRKAGNFASREELERLQVENIELKHALESCECAKSQSEEPKSPHRYSLAADHREIPLRAKTKPQPPLPETDAGKDIIFCSSSMPPVRKPPVEPDRGEIKRIKIILVINDVHSQHAAIDIQLNGSSLGDCGTKIHDLFVAHDDLAQFINRSQWDEIVWAEGIPVDFRHKIEDERLLFMHMK